MKKEWKIILKVLQMSGKLMALGCLFPPKFPNSGTLFMEDRLKYVIYLGTSEYQCSAIVAHFIDQ